MGSLVMAVSIRRPLNSTFYGSSQSGLKRHQATRVSHPDPVLAVHGEEIAAAYSMHTTRATRLECWYMFRVYLQRDDRP
jgi:hypothetical protein